MGEPEDIVEVDKQCHVILCADSGKTISYGIAGRSYGLGQLR